MCFPFHRYARKCEGPLEALAFFKPAKRLIFFARYIFQIYSRSLSENLCLD